MNTNVYNAVKNGRSDNNINYSDFQNLIIDLGFIFMRKNGSHSIYFHKGINALMTTQPLGSKAKDYQVKQLRAIIKKYNL